MENVFSYIKNYLSNVGDKTMGMEKMESECPSPSSGRKQILSKKRAVFKEWMNIEIKQSEPEHAVLPGENRPVNGQESHWPIRRNIYANN